MIGWLRGVYFSSIVNEVIRTISILFIYNILSVHLPVHPSFQYFFQEWLISFFLIFDTMINNWNIEKMAEPFFLQRFILNQICLKKLATIHTFYGGPVIFTVTCFLAQPDCRIFLPGHCNTVIKNQLCGEELPSSLPLLQVDVFHKKQGILQQIKLCQSNKPKKAFIWPFDTNSSTQSLTRM